MGYSVTIEPKGVVIRSKEVPGAIQALRELMGRANTDGNGGDGKSKWYSWVDTDSVNEALDQGDIVDALKSWRYETEEHPVSDIEQLANQHNHGDIYFEYFSGQKWSNDNALLFEAIAPFVESNKEDPATIECIGEDDAHWRYVFLNGAIEEQGGEVRWLNMGATDAKLLALANEVLSLICVELGQQIVPSARLLSELDRIVREAFDSGKGLV